MTYYIIFCVATALTALFTCQIKGVRNSEYKHKNNPIFWLICITVTAILAPTVFFMVIFYSKTYTNNITEKLNIIASKNNS